MLFREDPVKYLERYLLPGTIDEARDYLTRMLETSTLYAYCDKSFPAIFRARFPGAWMRDQEMLLPDQEAGRPWGKGELKCLELISELRIPFFYDQVEMVAEEEGERVSVVPIVSYGINLWESEVENESGWKMIALLDRDLSVRDASFPPEVLTALKRARSFTRSTWSWEVLKSACASCEEPLSFLWIALQMLNHDTGNVFLDPTYEAPYEEATWTWEDLEWLDEDWGKAQEFTAKADRLAEWLAKTPCHFRKAVNLWNLATWNMLMRE